MDRRRRMLSLTIGLVVTLVAAALIIDEWPRVRSRFRPPQAGLPAPADIVELRAAAWASGSRGQYETDVPEFVVPADQIPHLWRRFEPNTYEPIPPADPDRPFGELAATTRDGRVTRVRFYETGGDDLVFTTDGEHFFRSEPRGAQGDRLGGAFLLAGTLRKLSTSGDWSQ